MDAGAGEEGDESLEREGETETETERTAWNYLSMPKSPLIIFDATIVSCYIVRVEH